MMREGGFPCIKNSTLSAKWSGGYLYKQIKLTPFELIFYFQCLH